ncbi:hypothetical protein C7H85_17295 [Zobellella endophytica]|uniref:Uncharacterized protein n=1 Tax=Zobellella endophytica TaxID=2116700 RepID=A0A2P7QWM2_9GAMM|nr:hypothetical protein [Zobellella endophytica]PSJ42366.1 hypothetical protein C7H85_17295 [Zobellella endophytica]
MKWSVGVFVMAAGLSHGQEIGVQELIQGGSFGIVLDDTVLEHQRGKFISGRQAHYFGIEFVSSMVGPHGMVSTVGMQVGFSPGASPELEVRSYQDGLVADVQPGAMEVKGSGLVQTIQLAGLSNTGINELAVKNGLMPLKGTELALGHYSVALPGGITARYDVSSAGMGVGLYAEGDVFGGQSLRSNPGGKGIVQQLRAKGDNQLLFNQANLYLDLADLWSLSNEAKSLKNNLPMEFIR